MTKVTVEIELDNVEYDKAHGPGSEYWARHGIVWSKTAGPRGDGDYVPKPDSEYKSLEGEALVASIIDILGEGFYDWQSKGWLKLAIDGKAVRECCNTVDGDKHKDWCEKIAGPEASEIRPVPYNED